MPRPKRTKVASATAPSRVTKSTRASSTKPIQRNSASRKSFDRLESFSDDSDGLVVKATKTRSSGRDAELTMTGALPVASNEEKGSIRRGSRRRAQSPKNIGSSKNVRTPPSDVSKRVDSTQGRNKVLPQGTLLYESDMVPAEVQNIAHQEEESSMLDPSLLTFGSLGSESPDAHGTRPPSAMKIGATPAHETSILALKNFKRRPRQLSLLHQTRQAPNLGDDDEHSLDHFDFDELDDFHPDAESTPVLVRKSGVEEDIIGSSNSSHSSTGSRGKKRKLTPPVVQVPCSSPPYDPPSGSDVVSSQRSPSPSLPDNISESREEVLETQEHADCEIFSETMAPPRSSSPPVTTLDESPPRPRQRRRRKVVRQDSGNQDFEGEETDRPTRSKARTRTRIETLSTAKLQALLPRRRTRIAEHHDEFDVVSSEGIDIVDSDQDELQQPAPRARKSAAAKPVQKTSRASNKSRMPVSAAKKNTRTYGRRISSDKENESTFVANEDSGDVDEPTEISATLPGTQLAAIARKFEDVDAWEMDFESVDVTGGSSSPWR